MEPPSDPTASSDQDRPRPGALPAPTVPRTHSPATLPRLLLATVLAWLVLHTPALVGWKHGAAADRQATWISLEAPIRGLIGFLVGAVVLRLVWLVLRRRNGLGTWWPTLCWMLGLASVLLGNWLVDPLDALWVAVELVASSAVATALCAQEPRNRSRLVLVAMAAACVVALAVHTSMAHQRYEQARRDRWQQAASRYWVFPDAEMARMGTCYAIDHGASRSWTSADGRHQVDVEQKPSSAPASAPVGSPTSRYRVLVETGGARVSLVSVGPSDLTAAQLLPMARTLRPVDAAWMIDHCH